MSSEIALRSTIFIAEQKIKIIDNEIGRLMGDWKRERDAASKNAIIQRITQLHTQRAQHEAKKATAELQLARLASPSSSSIPLPSSSSASSFVGSIPFFIEPPTTSSGFAICPPRHHPTPIGLPAGRVVVMPSPFGIPNPLFFGGCR